MELMVDYLRRLLTFVVNDHCKFSLMASNQKSTQSYQEYPKEAFLGQVFSWCSKLLMRSLASLVRPFTNTLSHICCWENTQYNFSRKRSTLNYLIAQYQGWVELLSQGHDSHFLSFEIAKFFHGVCTRDFFVN